MKSRLSGKGKRKCGFTLVEIVVVLLIIAVLASIAIYSLTGYIDKSSDSNLVASLRACVIAAQTLVNERYAEGGIAAARPTNKEILELAEIKEGTLSSLAINPITAKVNNLTYTCDGKSVYYSSKSANGYGSIEKVWVKGDRYTKDDIMIEKDFVFLCLVSHTSGSRSNTRNPTVKSNKGSWEVIGYKDGIILPYSPTVRYGVGMIATYKNNVYARTEFNLTGGQTPYSKSSSRYWILLGSVEDMKDDLTLAAESSG